MFCYAPPLPYHFSPLSTQPGSAEILQDLSQDSLFRSLFLFLVIRISAGIQPNPLGMSNSTRCAACRYLRRRCTEDCVLAPYFPSTHPDRFACVHRIFGASNVSRMLQVLPYRLPSSSRIAPSLILEHILNNGDHRLSFAVIQLVPVEQRGQAADSIAYEAYWRMRDPVYGCVGIITRLQQEIQASQRELAETRALVAMNAAEETRQREIPAAWDLVSFPSDDFHQPPPSLT